MVANGEKPGTDDVVALMAQIQTAATQSRKFVEAGLQNLREATRPLLQHSQTASPASESQREANELFVQLIQAMSETGNSAPFHDLVELGRLSDSGSTTNRVRRRLLAPQERFNLELLGRLADLHIPLAPAAHASLHVAVTARLVASVNVMLQALSDLEQGVEAWDREEAPWRAGVVSLLEEVLQKLQDQYTRAADNSLVRLATQTSVTELRQWAEEATETVMGYVGELSIATAELRNESSECREAYTNRFGQMEKHLGELSTTVFELTNGAEQLQKAQVETSGRIMGYVEDLSTTVSELQNETCELRKGEKDNSGRIMGYVENLSTTVSELKNESSESRKGEQDNSGRIMGYVENLSTTVSELQNETCELRKGEGEKNSRLMDHVTALSIRLKQVEEERQEAVAAAEAMGQRMEELALRMAELERRPIPVTPPRAEGNGDHRPAALPSTNLCSPDGSSVSIGGPDFDFLVWEELTRGDESTISDEQRKYIPWFENGAGPILDAGCGRGEFLELLKTERIDAYGIDADPSMAAHCQAKGLRVEQAELFDHLRSLPDDFLGGLFLGQVVEHIPPASLRTLTDLAWAKLCPGGAIVMETINPTCLTTFSGAFYADPTHQKPVHPKALEYFLTASGFDPMETIFSAPIPPESKLAPLREEAPLDPSVKSVVLQVERNFERLNSVLYGWANYAAAARKPVR